MSWPRPIRFGNRPAFAPRENPFNLRRISGRQSRIGARRFTQPVIFITANDNRRSGLLTNQEGVPMENTVTVTDKDIKLATFIDGLSS